MKTLAALLLFSLLVTGLSAEVDLDKPVPSLALADGRVLREARFAEFKTEGVLIKHKGGSAYLIYEAIPEEYRAAAEKRRPGGPRWFPGATAAEKLVVNGQIFITTRGAGAYKFSDVTVYAFPIEALAAWDMRANPVQLPRPLAKTVSDADGKFTLTLPKQVRYFIFAQAQRLMISGYSERYEWRAPSVDFKPAEPVHLSGAQWVYAQRPVQIEEQL